MSRYIDAEKAIEVLAKKEMYEAQADWPNASDDLEDWKELVIERLENVPSIEIVRCADCVHFRPFDAEEKKYALELTHRELDGWCRPMMKKRDDFCSDGERKTDDDTH